MTRKILLLTIFVILAYGFWVSPEFKTIAAGVAIFLLGMYALEEGFKAFSGDQRVKQTLESGARPEGTTPAGPMARFKLDADKSE